MTTLEAEILAASQPLVVPGFGERRVLAPAAAQRLAAASGRPRWEVEALALEAEVVPLQYLRNLARFGGAGQVRLLRASVTLIGRGAVLERALDLLAAAGIGRFAILVPVTRAEEEPARERAAQRLARVVRNRSGGAETTADLFRLRSGNPAARLRGADAAGACLESAQEEQLLQFACRMAKVPLVLAAAEEGRGQATTVFPGDPGTALVYRPTHPHLSLERAGMEVRPQAALMAGAWLAEQVTGLLLEKDDLLRGRLLYADVDTGEIAEHPL
jgi:molybdopterin/thiamine biosynthesis adenylyltransferase